MPDRTRPRRVALDGMLPTAVPDLAAKVADLYGLPAIVTVGWNGWSPRAAYPNLRVMGLGQLGQPSGLGEPGNPSRPQIPWSSSALAIDVPESLGDGQAAGPAVAELTMAAPLAVLRVPNAARASVTEALDQRGVKASFVGSISLDTGGVGTLLIIDRAVGSVPGTRPPSDFRVLAVLTTFNEADILATTIETLHRDGVEIHLVDNWSTDSTFEIAGKFAEAGWLTLERFPDQPAPTFNHADLLRRVEDIAERNTSSWVIHHDTDERRRSPWPGVTLRDGLWAVQQSGFNAVNHTVLTFRPIDNTWQPGIDPELHLRYFEVEPRPDLLLQVKAWRSSSRVDLASTGGHEARFDGRRIFPYHFLLKHYPLRSQEQAERKIFKERRARWNEAERAKGWHHHYDVVRAGQSFIWPVEDLVEFVDGRSQGELIVPLIGGAEVGQPWAAKARMAAIEEQLMAEQTLRVQQRLERVFGRTAAAAAVNGIRRIAWIVRPFRRATARRKWLRTGGQASDSLV